MLTVSFKDYQHITGGRDLKKKKKNTVISVPFLAFACVFKGPQSLLLLVGCIETGAEATGVRGSEFNSQGFMRRLTGRPARLATADLYSHESRRCHLQTGVKQMPH